MAETYLYISRMLSDLTTNIRELKESLVTINDIVAQKVDIINVKASLNLKAQSSNASTDISCPDWEYTGVGFTSCCQGTIRLDFKIETAKMSYKIGYSINDGIVVELVPDTKIGTTLVPFSHMSIGAGDKVRLFVSCPATTGAHVVIGAPFVKASYDRINIVNTGAVVFG